jgi:PAS domain S-box-containing protein
MISRDSYVSVDSLTTGYESVLSENLKIRNALSHTQNALNLAQAELSQILDSVGCGIRIINRDFTLRRINQTFSLMSGVTPEAAIGKKCWEVFTGPFCHTTDCRLSRILEGEENIQSEIERPGKFGNSIPCAVTTVSLRTDNGEVTGIIEIFKDITERRQFLAQVNEIADRYQALIDVGTEAGEAIIMLQDINGQEGIQTFVSDQWPRITGYTREELLGKPFFDFVTAKDRKECLSRHRQRMAGGTIPGLYEIGIIRKDSSEMPVELTASYTTYQGKLANVVYIRDIAERKKTESALHESEKLYHAVFDTTGTALVLIEADGTLSLVNQGWENLSGYSVKETLGKQWLFFIAPQARETIEKYHTARMVSPASVPKTYESSIMDKQGSIRNVLFTVSMIAGTNRRIVSILDITERKRIEAELVQHKDHLESLVNERTAQLTESIGLLKKADLELQCLYNSEQKLRRQLEAQIEQRVDYNRALVHELKTPLTSIMCSSDIMLEQLHDKKMLQLACNIKRGAGDLSKRINEMLDLARCEIGALKLSCEWIEPEVIAREVTEEMTPEIIRKRHDIILRMETALPLLWADGERLKQVLENLIGNALKFSQEGSRIELMLKTENEEVIFVVHDEGEGISEEDCQKIFVPYFHRESNQETLSGLGLGLAISAMLVKLHQGRIWVDSQKGKGSTFCFAIPQKLQVVEAAR